MPFSRSQVTAASTSPAVSVRAFLQSIIPAPVRSRRALTSFAEMSLTGVVLGRSLGRRLGRSLGRRFRGRRLGRLGRGDRGLGGRVLLQRLVGDRLAVLRGLLAALLARVVEVALGAVGALGDVRVGLPASALLHRLGDLGLGVLPRLALAAGDQSLLAGLLLGLFGGLLLGLLARLLLGLLAGGLLGLLARLLLLGAEDVLPLGDDRADRAGDQRARADRVVVAGD